MWFAGLKSQDCLALFDLVTVYNMRDVCIILHLYMRAFAGPDKGAVIVFLLIKFIVDIERIFIRVIREAENVRILKL